MEEKTARLIDGNFLSEQVKKELAKKVADFKYRVGYPPGLAVLRTGNNPSGKLYVRQNKKACKKVGIEFFEITMPEDAREKDFIEKIESLNQDNKISGILIEFPLPEYLSEKRIIEALNPLKDVDCIHPLNLGKILMDAPRYYPCTPLAIHRILQMENIELKGKHVVILGRSNIVGKPLAAILLGKDAGATVTVCHSQTEDIEFYTCHADILIVSIGKAEFIKEHMIKEGAVLIDVGINFIPDTISPGGRKLVGDIDFEGVKKRASAITPVPGGVGPMTISMILYNTFEAAENLK